MMYDSKLLFGEGGFDIKRSDRRCIELLSTVPDEEPLVRWTPAC